MKDQQISKFLSLILRHKPEAANIELDPNGWVDVDELLTKLNASGFKVDYERLEKVVANNNKQRFKLDVPNRRIRANQGHSIEVNLDLQETTPPDILFHGTAKAYIPSIREKGIIKGKRQHVHLSQDIETAINVGQRHGTPTVIEVNAKQMLVDGHVFYRSDNGVWLTDHVAPQYHNYLD